MDSLLLLLLLSVCCWDAGDGVVGGDGEEGAGDVGAVVGEGWLGVVGEDWDGDVDVSLDGGVVVVFLAGVMTGVFLFAFLGLGVDVVVVEREVVVVDVEGVAEALWPSTVAFAWLALILGEERVPEMSTPTALEEISAFANAFVALLEIFIVKI